MDYIIWKKETYSDNWMRYDCGDELALQRQILDLIKTEGEIEVTVPIQYTVKISVSKTPAEIVPKELPKPKPQKPEVGKEVKVETTESRPPEDKNTTSKS